jgi:hypothetical protein
LRLVLLLQLANPFHTTSSASPSRAGKASAGHGAQQAGMQAYELSANFLSASGVRLGGSHRFTQIGSAKEFRVGVKAVLGPELHWRELAEVQTDPAVKTWMLDLLTDYADGKKKQLQKAFSWIGSPSCPPQLKLTLVKCAGACTDTGIEMLCCDTDGCEGIFHVHCQGLEAAPAGDWHCPAHAAAAAAAAAAATAGR